MEGNGQLDFASLADLDTFRRAVKSKNFRDDVSFPLKKRFRQKGPFRWFRVWKEATKGTVESGPFLAVANAAARRWWAAEGAGFEGFGYDSTSHVILIKERMKEGMHEEFWAAFERAGQKLGQKMRSCPDLARRLMLMEAEALHDFANDHLFPPLPDAEEARRRGGFAPPEDWRAIIETAMAQKRSSGKTNEAAPESTVTPREIKVYHCRYCPRSFHSSQGIAGHIAGHISRKDTDPNWHKSGHATRRLSPPNKRGVPASAPGRTSGSDGRPETAPAGGGTSKRGRSEAAPGASAAAAAPARPNPSRSKYDHRPGLLAAAAVLAKELKPECNLGTIMREALGHMADDDVIDGET